MTTLLALVLTAAAALVALTLVGRDLRRDAWRRNHGWSVAGPDPVTLWGVAVVVALASLSVALVVVR